MNLIDLIEPEVSPTMTIRQRFEAFHEANPQVYRELVHMTYQLKQHGRTRIGIKTLFETLRWRYWVETTSIDDFHLNNNFSAHYARLIMEQNEWAKGMFQLRKVRS